MKNAKGTTTAGGGAGNVRMEIPSVDKHSPLTRPHSFASPARTHDTNTKRNWNRFPDWGSPASINPPQSPIWSHTKVTHTHTQTLNKIITIHSFGVIHRSLFQHRPLMLGAAFLAIPNQRSPNVCQSVVRSWDGGSLLHDATHHHPLTISNSFAISSLWVHIYRDQAAVSFGFSLGFYTF